MDTKINEVNAAIIEQAVNRKVERYLTVSIRGEQIQLPVIRISLDNVILNYQNHRIKAQLNDLNINLQPEEAIGHDSQNTISDVLAKTAKFSDLKTELKFYGQLEPGIITRDGLLVNANTRAVALRQLKMEGERDDGILVAVLKDDLNPQEIIDIEISEQLFTSTHQDYTFTNNLLLFKEYLSRGNSPEQLAKQNGWIRRGKSKVETHMRLLGYIEELRSFKSPPIPYSEFDNNEEVFKNLDSDYMSLIETDLMAAEDLKHTRFLALLLGLSKDNVRILEEDTIFDLYNKKLSKEDPSREFLTNYITKVETDDNQEIETPDIKKVIEELVKKDDPDNDINSEYLDEGFDHLKDLLKTETDRLINDQRRTKSARGPFEIMRNVRNEIETAKVQILEKYDLMQNEKTKGNFKYELGKAISEITSLKNEYDKLEKNDK